MEKKPRDYTKDTAWKKENTRLFAFRFTRRTEQDIIDWIESKPSMNDYLRSLVIADMEAHGVTHTEAE